MIQKFFIALFLFPSLVLADGAEGPIVLRNNDGTVHTTYKGSSLKVVTYSLNPSGMSIGSCSSTVEEKVIELEEKGFKVLDSDVSRCNDRSAAMFDSHEVDIIFE